MGHWADNHVDNYHGSPVRYKCKRKSKLATTNKNGISTLVFRGRLQ